MPSTKSPLTPYAAPPKLKIPLNGTRTETVRTPATAAPLAEGRRAVNGFAVPAVPPKKVVKIQKPVPKTQSGGMSRNDVILCRKSLEKLKARSHAALFLQPVDPVRDGAPK